MAVIAGLSAILFYVFAVMGTDLYSETFPQWFGSISETIFTLFQIMTLEGWAMNIVRPMMEVHPYAWTFFIPFILIATFIMINLIIAIVVEAMQEITKDDAKTEDVEAGTAEVHELREEILELKKLVNKIHDKL
jgi:voltage-gated sodium channel